MGIRKNGPKKERKKESKKMFREKKNQLGMLKNDFDAAFQLSMV